MQSGNGEGNAILHNQAAQDPEASPLAANGGLGSVGGLEVEGVGEWVAIREQIRRVMDEINNSVRMEKILVYQIIEFGAGWAHFNGFIMVLIGILFVWISWEGLIVS